MDVQPHLLNLSAYINQNLEKDLPLNSLAKRVGLSPFHFHRKFGAYFGESLHQHIKRLRLERAAFALTYSAKPVREIARESGYKTVSAFSHAFSGFAGQSPTRYRSRGASTGHGTDEPAEAVATGPRAAWVGELDAQPFAFLRAAGSGRGRQTGVRAAMDSIRKTIGAARDGATRTSTSGHGATVDGSGDADSPEFIVATTDLYGIARHSEFRVDVGVDAGRVPHDREHALGRQVLPPGRYARFDIHCASEELVERCYQAFLVGLKDTSESARPAPCFVRFVDDATDPVDDGPRDYRLFIPLTS